METDQEPQKMTDSSQVLGFGRELFQLKFDLTSREYELKIAKATESQTRTRMEKMAAETILLETQVADRDAKLREIRATHMAQIRQFGEQIVNLRDSVWTESQKSTALDRELESSKETLSIVQKELERAEEYRNQLLQDHILHRQSQESVIKDLGSRLEEFSRDNGRLSEEILELVEIRELSKKAYEETLGQLENVKTQQATEIKTKDQEIIQLRKELQISQRHLSQFTTNPSAQSKLISDLYAAYVAAEDKVATFEEKETALAEQQRRGIDSMQAFQDEVIELRGLTKEYAEALKIAERDLERLKKAGHVAPSSSAEIPPLDEADILDLRRELELYKEENLDEEKRKFFSTVARNPQEFQRLVSLSANDAVIWTFIAEHNEEDHVTEQKKLKHEVKVLRGRCLSLENHNDRLHQDWVEMQQNSAAETRNFNSKLQSALKESGDLRLQIRDVERLKQTHQADLTRYRSDLEELNRQFALEQLHLQELNKDLAAQQDVSRKLRSDLANANSASESLQQERDLLLMERTTLQREVATLRQDVVRLSATAPNVDAVYWMNEADRIKIDLDKNRQILENFRSEIDNLENLKTVAEDRDAIRVQNSLLLSEIDQLRKENQTLKTASLSREEKISNLEKKIEIEFKFHQISVDEFSDTKNELTSLRTSLNQQEILAKEISANYEILSRLNEEQEKIHVEESKFLEKERKNSEEWKEAFYSLVQFSFANQENSLDFVEILKNLKIENELLKKQTNLAKTEYLSVVAGINSLQRTIQRLQGELRNAVSAGPDRSDPTDAALWQKRFSDKKEMLSTLLEYSENLRSELLAAKNEISQMGTLTIQLREELNQARLQTDRLQAERTALLTEQKNLEEKLEFSNRRFDSDQRRFEIEDLKKAKIDSESKMRAEFNKMKQHYQSQFAEQKSKHLAQLETKNRENSVALEEMKKILGAKEEEFSTLKNALHAASDTHAKKEEEFLNKIRMTEKKLLDSMKSAKSLEAKLNSETEILAKFRLELQEASEKIRRLEAAIHAQNNVLPQTVVLDSVASPIVSLQTRRPTGATSPNVQSASPIVALQIRRPIDATSPNVQVARSTAVVTPNSHPSSIQRVTPLPQLRIIEPLFHPVAPPTTQESRQAHPVPSTSGTSNIVLPSLRRDTSAVGGGGSGEDPGSPSTSSSGNLNVNRKRPLSGLSFERDKRPLKREASPTFSDVTSSTSHGPKTVTPAGEGSVVRARANSTSVGHLNVSFPPALAHETLSMALEESDRAADSSDGNPDGNEPNQEGNVTESSALVREDSVEDQPFDRSVAQAFDQEREDDEEDQNGESMDDEEADENEQMDRSSEDRLSPPAVMDEEVVSDGDSNDNTNEGPGFAPREDEESSSGSYDAEDVERPAQSSSGVSLQEPSTSSSRLRLGLSAPLDRNLARARSPASSASVSFAGRAPGLMPARYDAGDEYGVVPSTPKFPVPRREDDGNAMPQVPSFFFGFSADAIEDVTASQVPPTPQQPDGDFFGQRLEIASEDSSSFQGPDDIMDPVPSGSGMHRDDSTSNIESSESGVGSSSVFSNREAHQLQDDVSLTGEASTSHEPAVPSPGSAGSSVEIASSAAVDSPVGLALVPPRGASRSGQRGRPRGSRGRGDNSRGRGAAAASAAGSAESAERRPVLAPISSPLTRTTTSASARSAVSRTVRRGTGGRGTRPGRRRSNLQ